MLWQHKRGSPSISSSTVCSMITFVSNSSVHPSKWVLR